MVGTQSKIDIWKIKASSAVKYIDAAIEHNVSRRVFLREPECRAILKRALLDTKFYAKVFMAESEA